MGNPGDISEYVHLLFSITPESRIRNKPRI